MNRQVSRLFAGTSKAGLAVFVSLCTAAAVEAQSSSPDSLDGIPLSIPAFSSVQDVPSGAPSAGLLPPVEARTLTDDEGEAMLRGPVHEAFAEQVNPDPVPGLVIQTKPPEAVEELPPEVRPEGRTVEWISGYWAWDEDRDDFMWVSGIWREVPQGFRWLPGYWSEVDGGYQWVSGTWVSTQTSEIEYLETAPPASLEQGPVGISPTVQHIWVPGCWTWTETRYLWRPGYWSAGYDNWVWVPARYHWTPGGYYYCNGYWDYPLERRGVLFAPLYFDRSVYSTRRVRFTPQIVVASNLLQFHFWVRPRYQHYYFGDYYGAPYASRGMVPWHHYHRQHHGSDPLFCHYSRGRGNADFYNRVNLQFNVFVSNPDHRPAHTFRGQDQWVRNRNDGPDRDHDHSHDHQHSLLGNRLQNVVDNAPGNSDGLRFVKLENEQRQRLKKDAEQNQSLASNRRDVEKVHEHRDGDTHSEDVKRKRSSTGQGDRVEGQVASRDSKNEPKNDPKNDVKKTGERSNRETAVAGQPRARGERLKLPPVERSAVTAASVPSSVDTNGDKSRGSRSKPPAIDKNGQNVKESPVPQRGGRSVADKKISSPAKSSDGSGLGDGKPEPQPELTRKQAENQTADVPQTPAARGERPRKLSPAPNASRAASVDGPKVSDRPPGVTEKKPSEKMEKNGLDSQGRAVQSGNRSPRQPGSDARQQAGDAPQAVGRQPAVGEVVNRRLGNSRVEPIAAKSEVKPPVNYGRTDSNRAAGVPSIGAGQPQGGGDIRQKQPSGNSTRRSVESPARDGGKPVSPAKSLPDARRQAPSVDRSKSVPNGQSRIAPNQHVPRGSGGNEVQRQMEGSGGNANRGFSTPAAVGNRNNSPGQTAKPQSRPQQSRPQQSAPQQSAPQQSAPVQRRPNAGSERGGGAEAGRVAVPRANEAAPRASGNPGIRRGEGTAHGRAKP